jgi:hypothetical protein
MSNTAIYYHVDAGIDIWEVDTYGMLHDGKQTTVTRFADIVEGTERYEVILDKDYQDNDPYIQAVLNGEGNKVTVEKFNIHFQAAVDYKNRLQQS